MKQVFRITPKYLAHETGFLSVFLLLLSGAMYWSDEPKTALVGVLAVLMLLLLSHKEWRTRLELDEQSLTLCEGNTTQVIHWDEVLFARLVESYHRPRKVLLLGRAGAEDLRVSEIKLDYYDHQSIWQLAQQYLPPSSLAEDAERKTPQYQAWAAEMTEAIKQLEQPLRANDWRALRLVTWGLVLFLVGSAVFLATLGQAMGAVLTASAAILFGAWLVLIARIEADGESITLKTPLNVYRMRWDEITRAESTVAGSLMVYGDNKYLWIPSSELWSSWGKTPMKIFICAQIELRRIPLKPIRYNFKFAKNTKVK